MVAITLITINLQQPTYTALFNWHNILSEIKAQNNFFFFNSNQLKKIMKSFSQSKAP